MRIRSSKQEKGQTMVEYATTLALVAIMAVLVVRVMGAKTTSTFDTAQSQMTAQGAAAATPKAASS
jgi:Flp pilus assembly pilin Flp